MTTTKEGEWNCPLPFGSMPFLDTTHFGNCAVLLEKSGHSQQENISPGNRLFSWHVTISGTDGGEERTTRCCPADKARLAEQVIPSDRLEEKILYFQSRRSRLDLFTSRAVYKGVHHHQLLKDLNNWPVKIKFLKRFDVPISKTWTQTVNHEFMYKKIKKFLHSTAPTPCWWIIHVIYTNTSVHSTGRAKSCVRFEYRIRPDTFVVRHEIVGRPLCRRWSMTTDLNRFAIDFQVCWIAINTFLIGRLVNVKAENRHHRWSCYNHNNNLLLWQCITSQRGDTDTAAAGGIYNNHHRKKRAGSRRGCLRGEKSRSRGDDSSPLIGFVIIIVICSIWLDSNFFLFYMM